MQREVNNTDDLMLAVNTEDKHCKSVKLTSASLWRSIRGTAGNSIFSPLMCALFGGNNFSIQG